MGSTQYLLSIPILFRHSIFQKVGLKETKITHLNVFAKIIYQFFKLHI